MKIFSVSWALVVCLTASAAWAAGGKAFTDPAEAGPDFNVQGEYVSTGESERWGAQVIALGDGKFDSVSYKGGLPGDGWDGKTRKKASGKTEGDKTVLKSDGVTLTIQGNTMTVTDSGGQKIDTLKKVTRTSETLGAKPPQGATVLFDGSSLDHWDKKTQKTEDGLLMQGATSTTKMQSFKGHLEFRLPYMPASRGQGRGNSGFYVQGRYEIQMLDSFGLEGKDNECGGIYKASAPAVNMCYPPLSWQTYDVDFTAAEFKDGKKVKNARITVKHNGVVIHDDLELPHGTPGGKGGESAQPGPVFLQNHGNPVRYRNIWIVEK